MTGSMFTLDMNDVIAAHHMCDPHVATIADITLSATKHVTSYQMAF